MPAETAHDDSPTRPLAGPRPARQRRPGGLLRTWTPSLIPAAVTLAAGRFRLGSPAPGPGEGTADPALSPALILEAGRSTDAVHVPYQLFLYQWAQFSGDSIVDLRVPSLIAVTLGVGLAAELGRRVLTPGAGLCGGLMLAALPIVSRTAQTAEPWAFAFLFATAATLMLYLVLDEPGWARWLGYGTSVALAGLAHPAALLVLAGHTFTVWSRWRLSRERALFWWFPVTVLALVPPAPLISLGIRQHTALFAWRPDTPWDLVRTLPETFFGAASAGLLVTGLALAARWPDRALLRELAVLAAVAPLALIAASFLTGPLWDPRYVLFALPAVTLCAAAALRGLWIRAVIAVVLVAALGSPQQATLRSALPERYHQDRLGAAAGPVAQLDAAPQFAGRQRPDDLQAQAVAPLELETVRQAAPVVGDRDVQLLAEPVRRDDDLARAVRR
jgi:mannosyltransferase